MTGIPAVEANDPPNREPIPPSGQWPEEDEAEKGEISPQVSMDDFISQVRHLRIGLRNAGIMDEENLIAGNRIACDAGRDLPKAIDS